MIVVIFMRVVVKHVCLYKFEFLGSNIMFFKCRDQYI